jgi:hypothetical protein
LNSARRRNTSLASDRGANRSLLLFETSASKILSMLSSKNKTFFLILPLDSLLRSASPHPLGNAFSLRLKKNNARSQTPTKRVPNRSENHFSSMMKSNNKNNNSSEEGKKKKD